MGKNPLKGGGESHRLAKVEREIRDVVGTYLLGGFPGHLPGFVSLTRVVVSADLKIARCHFTLLINREENETDQAYAAREVVARKEASKELNEYAGDVQHRLAQLLQMRYTPRVTFYYDEGYESAMKVERILDDLSKTKPNPDSEPESSED